ncbi:MAG TPA: hypothetical protein VFS43_18810 [Polyangiaceae bacterium]|nr:hypothetical protein [Polyangiaceae bacterium]
MNATFRSALAALRRALGDGKLVGLLLLANLLPSVASALAPSVGAYRAFGHSLVGRDEPFFGGDVLGELARAATKNGGGTWLAVFVLALLVSLPLQIALSGGVAARALEGQAPFSTADFVADCVRLFGRNARLFGWSLLGLVPVAVLAGVSSALVGKLDDPLGERSLAMWKALRFALVAAAFATWRLAFDAAKVRAVSDEPRLMRRAALRGLKDALTTRGLWPGYLALGLAGVLGLLLLARAHAALPVASTGGALLALAFAQIVLACRLVFSVAATNYVAGAIAPKAGPEGG